MRNEISLFISALKTFICLKSSVFHAEIGLKQIEYARKVHASISDTPALYNLRD